MAIKIPTSHYNLSKFPIVNHPIRDIEYCQNLDAIDAALYSKVNTNLEFDEFITTDFTNWETYLTGAGEVDKKVHWLRVHATSTENSKASCYCNIFNTVSGALPMAYGFFDIDVEIGWVIGMEDVLSTSKTFLLFGPNYTVIDPVAPSFGFRIDNLAAKGIVYDGASLHVIDLATTLTVNSIFRLSIVFTAGSKVEWFINGVLKGESTDIPSGISDAGYNKISVQTTNGATTSSQAINCFRTMFKQKTWG